MAAHVNNEMNLVLPVGGLNPEKDRVYHRLDTRYRIQNRLLMDTGLTRYRIQSRLYLDTGLTRYKIQDNEQTSD